MMRTALLSSGLIAVMAGCGDDAGDDGGALTAIVQAGVDHRIVPTTTSLLDDVEAFEGQVQALCSAPSEPTLADVRDGWLRVARRWNRAAVYVFGPLEDDPITPAYIFIESMRQRGIDYTQTVRRARDVALEGSEPLDEAYIDDLGFNRVGLLALEVLNFETSTATPANDLSSVAAEFDATPRKCEYLGGLTRRLRSRVATVVTGWTTDFDGTGDSYRDLMIEDRTPDGTRPVVAILLGVIDQLEYVRVRKLDGIKDARIAAAARPAARPFYANLEAGLEEIAALLGDEGAGVYAAMRRRGAGADVEVVRAQVAEAVAAVQAEDRARASDAYDRLEASFRGPIPRTLGVELGLNFSDGD